MINHFATPPDAPGGTRHYDFGVELAKRGYEVTIFASDHNYMLRKRIRGGESRVHPPAAEGRSQGSLLRHGGVRFVRVRSLRYERNNWRRVANMLSFALNVVVVGIPRKHPDVIIGSSPHLFAALSAYILAKVKGSKFHLEIRDLWPQVLIDMKEQRAKSGGGMEGHGDAGIHRVPVSPCRSLPYAFVIMLLRKIEALLYHEADRIIVLSEGAGKYIAERGIDPGKISLLPNGVYLEQFEISESRTSVRARLGLIDNFVVMYAGAHGVANALDTIIQSAAMISMLDHQESSILYPASTKVSFVLVGDGPCREELRQMVDEKGLNNVKMLSAVPKSAIPDLLNAADALVITLRSVDLFSYGVSPNKLFEYMASGKPILCAVNGETAALVTRANAGVVVEPENPEALVQAIISLVRDRKRCLIYGTNGRKFAEENFSRSRIVEGLVSMLRTQEI